MKLDARQLVARILPRREEEPPPPYSPADPNLAPRFGVPHTRSISPRPLPTPPAPARASSALQRTSSAPSRPHDTYSPAQSPHPTSPSYAPLSAGTYAPPAPLAHAPAPAQDHHRPFNHAPTPTRPPAVLRRSPPPPSPAYTPPAPPRRGPASFGTLPVALVHRVLMLALDPAATPDAWAWDLETERVRRLHWLFRDLRAVDRRLYLVATSILRDRLLPTYTALLQVPSSSPLPPAGTDATNTPVFASRSREAAVLDRFVAMRLGEDLRRLESTLSEDSGEEEVLFARLQPAARVEDLLLRLPAHLVTPPPADGRCTGELRQRVPLAHAHVAVTLSPLWAQLWLSYSPVNAPNTRGGRAGRSLVVEVRREKNPEDMVRAFGSALEWLRSGRIGWGWSFRSGG